MTNIMKFELKSTLVFSGNIKDAEEDIGEIISKANEDLLKRGVPEEVGDEGGAEVKDFSVKEDELEMFISSDRYVRAHDAALRLRKKFNEKLGPEYHVGVRDLEVKDYQIEFELEREAKDDFQMPFVDKLEFEDSKCRLKITELNEEQLSKNYIDRIINRVQEKVDAQYYEGKEEMWELIWESEEKEPVWEKDPTDEMEEKSWIKRGPTKGKWFYRPEAAKILKTIERIAVEEILEPSGFEEVIESMMVPFDVWIDTGHMEGIPNEAYYISEPATRNPDEWEDIIDEIKITQEVPLDKMEEMTETPKAGICYAQCPVIYWSLKNETIADESLPLLLYENTVTSTRYESGGRQGIERVDEFHRIEPVYIGTKDQLFDLKEELIDRYKHVFNQILDIEWRIAQVEPFYLQQAGDVDDEMESNLGTVDFEAYLPYRGTREESEWLEFGNLSIFGKYTDAFNIKSQSQSGKLYSGCTGIGIERWAIAFLAQKGLDPENWPEEFKEYFGEMPDGIEIL